MKVVRYISGVLLLDKEQDLTSNTALQRVKRLFAAKKAGHTGTLDPFATGLLVVCLGQANKYSRWLLDGDKAYEFTISLGSQTDTADNTGQIVATKPLVEFTQDDLDKLSLSLIGEMSQIPPNYSALKVNGLRAYELARAGVDFELASRQVCIYDLSLTKIDDNKIIGNATVSKGTYIRVLVEDIAKQLNMLAHCSTLRRTSVSLLAKHLDKMRSFAQLQDIAGVSADIFSANAANSTNNVLIDFAKLDEQLLPIDSLCQGFEAINIDAEQWSLLAQGKICDLTNCLPNINKEDSGLPYNNVYRIYLDAIFMGLVEYFELDNQPCLRAFRLMAY